MSQWPWDVNFISAYQFFFPSLKWAQMTEGLWNPVFPFPPVEKLGLAELEYFLPPGWLGTDKVVYGEEG